MSYQVSEKITQLPPVAANQNGTNTPHALRTLYDEKGRVTWAKSPRGFLTHFQYDDLTGALVRRIDDVNTTLVSNGEGWSTPNGGGTHLISDFKVDSYGRVLRSLGPQHAVQLLPGDTTTTLVRRAEFRLYRDAMNEEWSASGYEKVKAGIISRHVVGPVLRVLRDPAGRVTDEILVARTVDSWAPSLADMENRATWCGWKRHTFDTWGRVTATRVYHRIPASGDGLPTADDGVSITGDYDDTLFGYDFRGRQNRVKEATGTITRTVFDVRGQPVSTWVGTNDAGATDEDPSNSGAGGNNMVRVSLREYDKGLGGGNGNLTRVTAFPDGNAAHERVSTFDYDFRDRLTDSSALEDTGEYFRTHKDLDGLGRATSVYRYRDEPGVSSLLISRTDASYDSRGRTWREDTWGADPVSGAQTSHALRAERWFDADGNVIKSAAPGSEAREKIVYDGLDRAVARYIVLEAVGAGGGGTPAGPGDGGESGGVPEEPVSSSSGSMDFGFSSSSSESADQPGPPDGKDPLTPLHPAWPYPRASSSDDRTIIIFDNQDQIRGNYGLMAIELSEKTCPNCCERSGEGGNTDAHHATSANNTGGTCHETSDGESGNCPVHYATGQKSMMFSDLSASAGGVTWGHSRVVNNRVTGATGGPHGHGVMIREQPMIHEHGGRTVMQSGGMRNVWFDSVSGGGFKPSFGGNRARLVAVPTLNELQFSNRSGDKTVFHALTHPTVALRGKLKSTITRGGQSVTPVYNSFGTLISATLATGGNREIKFTYYHYPNTTATEGGNAGRIKMVVVDSGTAGAPEERRRVRYEYYSPGSSHGADGDLRLVSHEEWDGSRWLTVRCEYYRYYTAAYQDTAGRRGHEHLLKYSVSAAGCAAMGAPDSYDGRTDAELAPFADYFFEYDDQDRVFREYMNGGTLLHEFTYTQSSLAPGFTGDYAADTTRLNTNVWHMLTTETVKDLRVPASPRFISRKSVYTNLMGKVIVSRFEELTAAGATTGRHWTHHNVFDSEGRFVRRVSPAAVLSSTAPGPSEHIAVTLRTSGAALLDILHYTSAAGGVEGLVHKEIIRNGTADTTGFVARLYEYGTWAPSGAVPIFPTIREVQFALPGESMTGALETRTQYAYHGMTGGTSIGTLPVGWENLDNATANRLTGDTGQPTDTVFQQEKHAFDRGGNLIFTRSYQRYHTANAAGELHGPTGASPRARRSYAAFYPDAMGRAQLTADFGTNGGVPMLRPDICPASTNALVKTTRTLYNTRGEAFQFIDPMGTLTEWANDCAGRRTTLIENKSTATTADANRTTNFTYGKGGLLRFMDIANASTGSQRTEWIYGTVLVSVDPAGSLIATGHLLKAKKYATDTTTSFLTWRYNQLGEVMEQKDANGTKREFSRDRLGRLSSDHATTIVTGIDNTITKLGRAYNRQGRLKTASSYDSAGGVVNEVGFEYTAFGQLAADRQAHGGAVDFGTAATATTPAVPSTTPSVVYAYATGAANHLRLTSLTYPTASRVLEPGYDTTGSINDRLSRVRQLRLVGETNPVANYTYAGLSWIVEASYPEPGSLTMTHIGTATPVGEAGDPYHGVDRFGRLKEVRWSQTAGPVESLTYGYDKADNRRWKDNPLVPGTSPQQDELYSYDGLYQVTSRQRGTLTIPDAITGVERLEQFDFDSLGNWSGYRLNQDGIGTLEIDHTRTHNRSNQITGIIPAGGPAAALVAHDANGNMTKTVPDVTGDWTKGYLCTWDAWNRLVKVAKQDAPSTIVGEYRYDALFRRTTRTVGTTIHHEYWDAAWRLLEERTGTAAVPAGPVYHYLYGLQRRNDLILRDVSPAPAGTPDASRIYLAYDWINPTAILSRNGTLLARQVFSAFGIRDLVRPDWTGFTTLPASLADWNFGFHGQFTDSETGWANYGFRYYSAQIGRWIRPDPLMEKGSLNLLGFVINSPIQIWDILGLTPQVDASSFSGETWTHGLSSSDQEKVWNYETEWRRNPTMTMPPTPDSRSGDNYLKGLAFYVRHLHDNPGHAGEMTKNIEAYKQDIDKRAERLLHIARYWQNKCCLNGVVIKKKYRFEVEFTSLLDCEESDRAQQFATQQYGRAVAIEGVEKGIKSILGEVAGLAGGALSGVSAFKAIQSINKASKFVKFAGGVGGVLIGAAIGMAAEAAMDAYMETEYKEKALRHLKHNFCSELLCPKTLEDAHRVDLNKEPIPQ